MKAALFWMEKMEEEMGEERSVDKRSRKQDKAGAR
jgi:hypothetical protein